MLTTSVGESVFAMRVDRYFPTTLTNIVTYIEFVERDMVDFDVILEMDWLCDCFTSIDCRTRVVKITFPNEPILEWNGEIPLKEVVLFFV